MWPLFGAPALRSTLCQAQLRSVPFASPTRRRLQEIRAGPPRADYSVLETPLLPPELVRKILETGSTQAWKTLLVDAPLSRHRGERCACLMSSSCLIFTFPAPATSEGSGKSYVDTPATRSSSPSGKLSSTWRDAMKRWAMDDLSFVSP